MNAALQCRQHEGVQRYYCGIILDKYYSKWYVTLRYSVMIVVFALETQRLCC